MDMRLEVVVVPVWPQWYAEHMTRTLGSAGYRLTGPSA